VSAAGAFNEGAESLASLETAQEGVTANMVGAIRAAATLQVHSQAVKQGMHAVMSAYTLHAIQKLAHCPGVHLHGAASSAYSSTARLPLVTFNIVVKRPMGQGPLMLHPRFVSSILSDVYGIQVSLQMLRMMPAGLTCHEKNDQCDVSKLPML
jgi:selenocysteine lyase/cysteine desulfurase